MLVIVIQTYIWDEKKARSLTFHFVCLSTLDVELWFECSWYYKSLVQQIKKNWRKSNVDNGKWKENRNGNEKQNFLCIWERVRLWCATRDKLLSHIGSFSIRQFAHLIHQLRLLISAILHVGQHRDRKSTPNEDITNFHSTQMNWCDRKLNWCQIADALPFAIRLIDINSKNEFV